MYARDKAKRPYDGNEDAEITTFFLFLYVKFGGYAGRLVLGFR